MDQLEKTLARTRSTESLAVDELSMKLFTGTDLVKEKVTYDIIVNLIALIGHGVLKLANRQIRWVIF